MAAQLDHRVRSSSRMLALPRRQRHFVLRPRRPYGFMDRSLPTPWPGTPGRRHGEGTPAIALTLARRRQSPGPTSCLGMAQPPLSGR